jgi:hypothetical protein
MRLWGRRWLWCVAGSGAAAAAGLGVWLWLGTGGRYIPPARARVYMAFSACLLTGPRGLADGQVAPVWAGMEEASLATRAKVSYLPVAGPATVGAAMPYLGSLVVRHCNVIIAVGAPETAAVSTGSGRFPGIRFVTVGPGTARSNVTVVPTGPAGVVRSRVADLVEAAARQ